MIYIVRSGDTPFVKIGFAEDVAERVKLLQCGNPETLHLLRTMEGGREIEGWLHRRYRHLRHRSEWFTFDADMLTVNPPAAGQSRPDTPFERYLQETGLSYVAFADKLGVSAETVRRYAAAERIPRPRIILDIVELSGGRVTFGDLMLMPRRTAAIAERVPA